MRLLLLVVAFILGGVATRADSSTAESPVKVDAFRSAQVPFSFVYDGKSSRAFLANWRREETTSGDGLTHRFTFTDPATGLAVTAEVRTFDHYPAVYWKLNFTNTGTADTPIIENLLSLDWADALPGEHAVLHGARGAGGGPEDYTPIERPINGGDGLGSQLGSNDQLPFFELQSGDHGLIGALGWWGQWRVDFHPNAADSAVSLTGGMTGIHLKLHPGESIRPPTVLLMPTHGDWLDATNLWRHLAIDDLSPRTPDHKKLVLPIEVNSGGDEPIANKIALIKAIHAAGIPMGMYEVDAGWSGDPSKSWIANIGSWQPVPKDYPNGVGPLGDALHALGYQFVFWMSAGEAGVDSTLVREHPDWFIPTTPEIERAKFEDPEIARKLTAYIAQVLKDAHADWFRQDGASPPLGPGEPADRAGYDQIQYVNNYLKFWDDLRTEIPGLQIDNCYSGGKRLDLETIQRSVSLWRSDAMVGAGDPVWQQSMAQGMIQWVPMSAGVYPITGGAGSPRQLYEARCSYCAGWDFGITNVEDWMRAQGEEYLEVQPYYYGDFYPLLHDTLARDMWSAWQLDRPDLKSGVVILLRRPESPFTGFRLQLRAIDPAAKYQVEVRRAIAHVAPVEMSGAELMKLEVPVMDEPGSALVFYRKE